MHVLIYYVTLNFDPRLTAIDELFTHVTL